MAFTNPEDTYNAARREARKAQLPLPVLSEQTVTGSIAGEYRLGTFEIPLKKIRGTVTEARRHVVDACFRPLLELGTEFGQKWIALCRAHLEEGISHPIQVTEYLGYYYVEEGHKRVSVLSAFGAYSITAEVTRIPPPPARPEEHSDLAVMREYMTLDRMRPVRHLWFSRPGRLTELCRRFEARGLDYEELYRRFLLFRQEYHDQDFTDWPQTTGDAYYDHSLAFPDLLDAESVKDSAAQWRYRLLHENQKPPALRYPAGPSRNRPLQVAFAHTGRPATDEATRLHEIARYRLEAEENDVQTSAVFDLPPNGYAWLGLEDMLEREPDLLVVPDDRLSLLALRAGLVRPETIPLVIGPVRHPECKLSTAWALFDEPAYVLGALAATQSASGRIGIQGPLMQEEIDTPFTQLNAFALGALWINPRARVYCFDPVAPPDDPLLAHALYTEGSAPHDGAAETDGEREPGPPTLGHTATPPSAEPMGRTQFGRPVYGAKTLNPLSPQQESFQRFAEWGVDVVWRPATLFALNARKIFPGCYATLSRFDPVTARLQETVAAAAAHWVSLYATVTEELRPPAALLEELRQGAFHLRLGLESGLLRVHLFEQALHPQTSRLAGDVVSLVKLGRWPGGEPTAGRFGDHWPDGVVNLNAV